MARVVSLVSLCAEYRDGIIIIGGDEKRKVLLNKISNRADVMHTKNLDDTDLRGLSDKTLVLWDVEVAESDLPHHEVFACFGKSATQSLFDNPNVAFKWNCRPVSSFMLETCSFYIISEISESPNVNITALIQRENGVVQDGLDSSTYVIVDSPPRLNLLEFLKMRTDRKRTKGLWKGQDFINFLQEAHTYDGARPSDWKNRYPIKLFEGLRLFLPCENAPLKKHGLVGKLLDLGAVVESGLCRHCIVLLPQAHLISTTENRMFRHFDCPKVDIEWIKKCLTLDELFPVSNYMVNPQIQLPFERVVLSEGFRVFGNGDSLRLKEVLRKVEMKGAEIVGAECDADLVICDTVLTNTLNDSRCRTIHCVEAHLRIDGAHPCKYWHYPILNPGSCWVRGTDITINIPQISLLANYLKDLIIELGGNYIEAIERNAEPHLILTESPASCLTKNMMCAEDFITSLKRLSDRPINVMANYTSKQDPAHSNNTKLPQQPSLSAIANEFENLICNTFSEIRTSGYLMEMTVGVDKIPLWESRGISVDSFGTNNDIGFLYLNNNETTIFSGVYRASTARKAMDFCTEIQKCVKNKLEWYGMHLINQCHRSSKSFILCSTDLRNQKLFHAETRFVGEDSYVRFEMSAEVLNELKWLNAKSTQASGSTVKRAMSQVIEKSHVDKQDTPEVIESVSTKTRQSFRCNAGSEEIDVKDVILEALNDLHHGFIKRRRLSVITNELVDKLESTLKSSPYQNPRDMALLEFDEYLKQFKVKVFGRQLFVCEKKLCWRAFEEEKLLCSLHT